MGLVLNPILTNLGLEKPSDAANRFAFFLGKPFVFIGYLIGLVWFGAALGEELLMRGYLLNRLADLFGKNKTGWLIALILHSTIFGMLHIYQGLHGVINITFVAIIFGVVYFIAHRRLFPVILAHILINTISLTAYYLSNGIVN
jgi:membrane protease YdiL (CAAX protease family)